MTNDTHGSPEHVDVLIVGAGISGIGGAHHLQEYCPDKSFVILDTKETFGGTWAQHTYPGIRSDSDLYTFGYKFKPWTGPPIATAEEILVYMSEVIEENDLDPHIRFQHTITGADWSSDDGRWTVRGERTDTGESFEITSSFLWMCAGYYRHAEGYTPDWEGMDRYQGQIVHPQTWPDDLDYAGKRVLVIGSGATAATLIPAMADEAGHVTMLQRSPTYFYPRPNVDELADELRGLEIPDEWVHEIIRRRNLRDGQIIHQMSAEYPEMMVDELIKAAREYLPEGFDIDTHFRPAYKPWTQRIAVLPDGDLFKGIASGDVDIVTDHIDTFTEQGVLLESGIELAADIIVTATGFHLNALGDTQMSIDGEPLDYAGTVTYRGVMFSDVPNMATVFGYLRTSWTMRSDLISDFVCRLLNHMDAIGATVCTPTIAPEDADMELGPFVPPESFNPGYMQRGRHLMPKQGTKAPWTASNDYYIEKDEFPVIDLDEPELHYR